MKMASATITAIFVLSLIMSGVGATLTSYYVREDFNSISGWQMTPADANISTYGGEVVIGMPNEFPDSQYYQTTAIQEITKNTTLNRSLDDFTVKTNIRIRTFGEPDWVEGKGTIITSGYGHQITIYSDNGDMIKTGIVGSVMDSEEESQIDRMEVYSFIYSSFDGKSTIATIIQQDNATHNIWYSGSTEIKFKQVSPVSYMATIYRYENYTFDGEKTPVEVLIHFNGNVSRIVISTYGRYTINKNAINDNKTQTEGRSDFLYIYVGSGEQTEIPSNVEATNTALYFLPAILLGVGLFTAFTGNKRYGYLILVAFVLFGVVAVMDSQFVLSIIGFLSAGIYGYNLKGGGMLG